MIYIYCLTNLETALSYVGMTQDIRSRWSVQKAQAKAGKPGPLMDALREHGFDVFVRSVLQECASVDEAYVAEREWIVKLSTLAPEGYNQFLGKKWDASAKNKQRQVRLGSKWSAEQRRTSTAVMTSPSYSATMVKALATSLKNKARLEKLKQDGLSTETIEKLRAASKAQFDDPDRRERHRQSVVAWHVARGTARTH